LICSIYTTIEEAYRSGELASEFATMLALVLLILDAISTHYALCLRPSAAPL